MIETKLLSRERSLVTLEVNVTEETIVKSMNASIAKLNTKYVFPGFRKGKAPRNIVEKLMGKDAIFEETVNIILTEAYKQAIKEHDLKPITDPDLSDLDDVDLGTQKAMNFKIKVTVEPEIVLANYKEWKYDRDEEKVTDAMVEEQINMIREDMAQFVPTERKEVVDGDLVTVDFSGFIDNVAFPGGSANDVSIYIGEKRFIPGFEEQIVGAVVDEEKEINVTFPLDYPQPDLVGKDAMFKILVKDIKAKELPEIGDEFAKDVADLETMDELKARIQHNMTHRMQDIAVRNLGRKVLDRLIEESTVEVPLVLVEDKIQLELKNMKSRVAEQGMTWDDYLAATKKTEEDIAKDMEKSAESFVKHELVVDELVEKEDIKVYVHEVDNAADHMTSDVNFSSPLEREKVLKSKELQIEAAKMVTNEKVVVFLGKQCDSNPIGECEECKAAMQAHKHDHNGCDCGCDHDHDHDHNGCDCECDHDHEHNEECDCGKK